MAYRFNDMGDPMDNSGGNMVSIRDGCEGYHIGGLHALVDDLLYEVEVCDGFFDPLEDNFKRKITRFIVEKVLEDGNT